MSRDRLRLLHILEAIERVRLYARDREAFLESALIQDAVVRSLEVIGEAVKALSDPARAKAPALPWREIAGLRDRLIHQYFAVDLDLVWDIVSEDLDSLAAAVTALLDDPEI